MVEESHKVYVHNGDHEYGRVDSSTAPHEHRWVGRGEFGGSAAGSMCADCGVDLDDLDETPAAPEERDRAVAHALVRDYGGTDNTALLRREIATALAKRERETWEKAIEKVTAVSNENDLDDGGFFEAGFIAARTKIIDTLIDAQTKGENR